jgi:uncharacterized protein YjhX (UPF0386 family)
MKKLGKMYRRRGENFPDSALALLNKLPSKKLNPIKSKGRQTTKVARPEAIPAKRQRSNPVHR